MGSIERVLLGQPEVNDKDRVTFLVLPNQEVVGLNVPVDEALRVNKLYPFEDLQPDHDDGLEGKTLAVLFEQRLKGTPQDFHDHDAFFSFSKVLVNLGEGVCTLRIPLSLDLPSLSKICRILD